MANPLVEQPARRTLELAVAAIALGVVVLLLAVVGFALSRFVIRDAAVGQFLAYLAVWVPLLCAVLVASRRFGSGSLARDFGFGFRPLDLLWGIGVGLLARAGATLIEVAVYGGASTGAVQLGEPIAATRLGIWLIIAALGPLVFAPLVEELFFRGLVLRALSPSRDWSPKLEPSKVGPVKAPAKIGPAILAIGVSSGAFALIHLVGASSPWSLVVSGGATLLFGIASGILAILTGRLGASIVAHITFNAVVVLPALLA